MSDQFAGDPDQFRKLVERARSIAHDPVGDDIKKSLHMYIERGVIIAISGNQRYFDKLEASFPISVNRVAWSKVNNSKLCELAFLEDGTPEKMSLMACVMEVKRWFQEWEVPADLEVVYFGDDSHLALRMTTVTFLECLVELVTVPEHGYVASDAYDWGIQISLEGVVYGGRSADSQVVGWIDGEIES